MEEDDKDWMMIRMVGKTEVVVVSQNAVFS